MFTLVIYVMDKELVFSVMIQKKSQTVRCMVGQMCHTLNKRLQVATLVFSLLLLSIIIMCCDFFILLNFTPGLEN